MDNEIDFDSLLDKLLENPPAPPNTFSVNLNTGSIYDTFKVLCYIYTELIKLYNRSMDNHNPSINLDLLPENFIDFVNPYMRSFGIEADYVRGTDKSISQERLIPHRECSSQYLEDYNFIISTRYIHTTRFHVL
jgi:hypothetical protein